ncbi:lamin tail domain-containing protein, partial [Chloroflexus sp.]
TPTVTKTPTATKTPTVTKTPTATKTPTVTKTPTATKTPKSAAVEETLPVSWPPGSVIISALLPAPATGQSEWIEVTNHYPTAIALEEWFVSDASGQRRFLPAQELAPGMSVRIPLSRPLLNNSHDTVVLHDPTGAIIDTFTYTSVTKDQVIWRQPDPSATLSISKEEMLSQSDESATDTLSSVEPNLTALAVSNSMTSAVIMAPRPTEPWPTSLSPRSPAPGYLRGTSPASTLTPTPSSIAEGNCADCVKASWSWSRIAAAIFGVIALLLFVAEPTPARAAQRDHDVL